jgi:hypothetical protein
VATKPVVACFCSLPGRGTFRGSKYIRLSTVVPRRRGPFCGTAMSNLGGRKKTAFVLAAVLDLLTVGLRDRS